MLNHILNIDQKTFFKNMKKNYKKLLATLE